MLVSKSSYLTFILEMNENNSIISMQNYYGFMKISEKNLLF